MEEGRSRHLHFELYLLSRIPGLNGNEVSVHYPRQIGALQKKKIKVLNLKTSDFFKTNTKKLCKKLSSGTVKDVVI